MSRHPFDLLMELRTSEIRLDCAALHLARDVYPTMSLSRYLSTLDEMAEAVAALRPGSAANLRYEAMHAVLVRGYELTGTCHSYYDPENFYLNHVLDARRGIPISLSIVWIEVARRLKWPVSGVALPGNFIVRFDDPDRFVLATPFHDGRSLSIDDCQVLVKERFDGRIPFLMEYLRPINTRGILLRVLKNLRNVYLSMGDWRRAETIVRRMMAVEPGNVRHLRDLAALCARQGNVQGAAAHLQLYLRRLPDGRDAHITRRNLQQLRAALLARN